MHYFEKLVLNKTFLQFDRLQFAIANLELHVNNETILPQLKTLSTFNITISTKLFVKSNTYLSFVDKYQS